MSSRSSYFLNVVNNTVRRGSHNNDSISHILWKVQLFLTPVLSLDLKNCLNFLMDGPLLVITGLLSALFTKFSTTSFHSSIVKAGPLLVLAAVVAFKLVVSPDDPRMISLYFNTFMPLSFGQPKRAYKLESVP